MNQTFGIIWVLTGFGVMSLKHLISLKKNLAQIFILHAKMMHKQIEIVLDMFLSYGVPFSYSFVVKTPVVNVQAQTPSFFQTKINAVVAGGFEDLLWP